MMDVIGAMQNAKSLEQAGRIKEALSAYRAIIETSPDQYQALMGAGRTACRLGDRQAGMTYFRDAGKADPTRPDAIVNLGLQQARDDLAAAAQTFDEGVARFPANERLKGLRTWVRVQMGEADDTEVFDLAAELEAPKYPETVYTTFLKKRKPLLSGQEYLGFQEKIAQVFRAGRSQLRLAMALVENRQYDKAQQLLDALPPDTGANATLGKAICAVALGRTDAAATLLGTFFDHRGSEQDAVVAAARFLDAAADPSAAASAIAALNRDRDYGGLSHLLEFHDAILPPRRPLLTGGVTDNASDLIDPDGTGASVLIFTGYFLKIGSVPLSLIDRFLAGHGIGIGRFADRSGHLFWNGIPSLADSLDATVAVLSDRLNAAQVSHLYTLGNSGGAVGAMVHGCRLGARRTLSFSGPSNLQKSYLAAVGDTRAQAVIHGLNKKLGPAQLDLRGWLEQQPTRPQIHAYYCEEEPHDTVQADNLGQVDGVETFAIAGYAGHDSFGGVLGTGRLLEEFNTMLAEIDHG